MATAEEVARLRMELDEMRNAMRSMRVGSGATGRREPFVETRGISVKPVKPGVFWGRLKEDKTTVRSWLETMRRYLDVIEIRESRIM